jgi:hypothetical protein
LNNLSKLGSLSLEHRSFRDFIMDEDRQRDIIRAYKIGRLNREEAIDELRHLDPNLIEPVLEILLNAVTRLNVVEINKSEN